MIKLVDMKEREPGNKVVAELFSDEKEAVMPTTGVGIEGLDERLSLSAGSSVVTAAGDFAYLKSDGTWNWL